MLLLGYQACMFAIPGEGGGGGGNLTTEADRGVPRKGYLRSSSRPVEHFFFLFRYSLFPFGFPFIQSREVLSTNHMGLTPSMELIAMSTLNP